MQEHDHDEYDYPDPEAIPSYPWLGRVVEGGPSIPNSSLAEPSAPWATDLSEDESDGQGDDNGQEDDAARMGDGDPAADPDFEYSDNSPTYGATTFLPMPRLNRRLWAQREEADRLAKLVNVYQIKDALMPGAEEFDEELEVILVSKEDPATMAFIAHDYNEAEALALEAINLNPEMFTAHSLLSEIHMARGDRDKATAALFNGAHTRPGDVQVWLRVADLLMERSTNDKNSLIPDVLYCLARVLNIQPKNVDVRFRRAALNRQLGYLGRAANEYEQLLKYLPHDAVVLRYLAEVYVELGDIDRAIQRYEDSITHHQLREPSEVTSFTWSDLNVYAELCGYNEHYETSIQRLKSLSRWLLGRGQDSTWESFNSDDREWDLQDEPRRIQIDGFARNLFDPSTYGIGLPLELRVKLGRHFAWLDPEDSEPGSKLDEYGDLFREAADALRVNDLYAEALAYYEPLRQSDVVDGTDFCHLALCYWKTGRRDDAENCYQIVVENGDDNVDIKFHVTEMCTAIGTSDKTEQILSILSSATNGGVEQTESASSEDDNEEKEGMNAKLSSMLASRTRARVMKPSALQRQQRELQQEQLEQQRNGRIADQFSRLQEFNARSREGDTESRREWMSAAQILIQDFRSNSIFYPTDKYMKFYGYTSEARAMSSATKSTRAAMIDDIRDVGPEGESHAMAQMDPTSIPQEYRGIHFDTWLDVFLEFAFMQAQQGQVAEAYDTITAAWNANVFYHSAQPSLLIHVCWFTCALLWNDESTLNNVCRWFMQEYQFVTDAYRLTAAIHRLCAAANTWYNCAPTQKYLLRQLKAMDFSLVGEGQKESFPAGRAGYTTKDDSGLPLMASDMDIALLMLYGHILYCGRSFTPALNYFFRAYALDPGNPMVSLSIALSYFHHAFKRQSDSRHHLVMQGFAFLSSYYDLRQASTVACERQEADYNVARAFHQLGLTHLAVPYYERCLGYSTGSQEAHPYHKAQDFSREAAFALQGLWAMGGELSKARKLSEEWLVI